MGEGGREVLVGAVSEHAHAEIEGDAMVDFVVQLETVMGYEGEIVEWRKFIDNGRFWERGGFVVDQPSCDVGI